MKEYKLNEVFEMNGKKYKTDTETLKVLNDIVPQYKETGDTSAIFAVMYFGSMNGRIIEMK